MPKILALSGGGGGAGTVTATGGALTANSVVLGAGTTDLKVIAGLTTDGLTQLNIGPADTTNNGILGLKGKTSGTATLTAPAVAGTVTNAVASSNVISAPIGTSASPSFQINPGANVSGITGSTGKLDLIANGAVAMDISGTATNITISSGFSFWFTGVIGKYNNISTVDNGVPSELGHLDLTGQVAAITATTIYTPTATGRFRVSIYAKVTTAATTSSILGGTTGFVLTFTDGTDSVAQSITMGLDNQAGTLAIVNNGNSTTTSLNGAAFIYAKTGVAIQLAVDYTSVGITPMAFAVRATCEAL